MAVTQVLTHNVQYVIKYVCILSMCVEESADRSGELYSTERHIGKPEKFPSQGGGNLEKRAWVPPELTGN